MTVDALGPGRTVLFVAAATFDACEMAFYRRLRDALQRDDLHLVLMLFVAPPPDLGVTFVRMPPPVDTYWPEPSTGPAATLDDLTLDPDALLAREEVCASPAILPAVARHRRQALEAIADHWVRTIAAFEPAVVLNWNGHHVVDVILDAACHRARVPVLYVERAPMAQALFVDERGLSTDSAVVRRGSWAVDDDRWRSCATAAIARIAAGRHTWWEQPDSRDGDARALRRGLGIPLDARVVLFASQIDGDTQQYMFSPHFPTNEAAFRWLLARLGGHADVYVLGKQHPKCPRSAAFTRALAHSGIRGQWRADVSIDDALAVSDRVAAVNSTVLYEALARERPVLSMGGWLLGGRGAAHEVTDLAKGQSVVDAWLVAGDNDARQHIWREALAFLLSTCLYTYEPEMEGHGMPGAGTLAERIARFARVTPHRNQTRAPMHQRLSALAPRGAGLEPGDARWGAWWRAQALRLQLLHARAEAGRGRRLMIWGAGDAGRIAHRLLERIGVTVDAFVSSMPDVTHVAGLPLLPAATVCGAQQDVFVLVASMAAHEIVPMLVAAGAAAEDFTVLDCNVLVETSRDLAQPAAPVVTPASRADRRTAADHMTVC